MLSQTSFNSSKPVSIDQTGSILLTWQIKYWLVNQRRDMSQSSKGQIQKGFRNQFSSLILKESLPCGSVTRLGDFWKFFGNKFTLKSGQKWLMTFGLFWNGQWLCGSVGRAVASDTRGPQFESSHRQKFIYIEHLFPVNFVLKRRK